jgi:hypothetical protein
LAFSDRELRLAETLTGARVQAGVQVVGKIVSAIRAMEPTGWRRWLENCGIRFGAGRSVRGWFQGFAGVGPEVAVAALQRLTVPLDYGLRQLPGNLRTLLSLEAAWARGAQAVVFTTVGCDPCGVEAVYAAVASHLDQRAALEFSYRYSCNGQTLRRHFPGSLSLEVTEAEALATETTTD